MMMVMKEARSLMKLRVFVTGHSIAQEAIALMEDNECDYAFGRRSDDAATIARKVSEFQPDGLVIRWGRITREVLAASGRLKAVGKHGVGVDNIDIGAATELGIPVMITASANFEAVAEYTLGLILALLHNILQQHTYTRNGGWDKSNYRGDDLVGKTLGLVGFGRIARRLCELVAPFRLKVLVYDPYVPAQQIPPPAEKVSDLHDMLPQVDILSIHSPLTPETRRLIGEKELALLRPHTNLINTARGGIVDEAALINALQSGAIWNFQKNKPSKTTKGEVQYGQTISPNPATAQIAFPTHPWLS